MRRLILVVIYAFSVYASCNKNTDCVSQTYSFDTHIKAYPDNDSININDTIWLEYISSTILPDLATGDLVEYSKANLSMSKDFVEFTGGSISNPGVVPSVNAFDYKLVHGSFIPDDLSPEKNRDYSVQENNSAYRFKLGIIPKRVGIFSIAVTNASNVYRLNDLCSKASFKITFANTNQHLYFYEQNRPGYTPSEYERTHMYCFKVK